MQNFITNLKGHQKAAIVIAVIVALADTVIVYDLYVSGAWLSPSLLSCFKTAALVLIFIGSLVAEMQPLSRRARALLLVAVLVLGCYQIAVNVVVNFHSANVPAQAAVFFADWLTPDAVTWWYAVVDGTVRTAIVILMWLVTGLTWRGAATATAADAGEVLAMEQRCATLESERDAAADARDTLVQDLAVLEKSLSAAKRFGKLTPQAQVHWIWHNSNSDGPTKAELARRYGVAPQTIKRWTEKKVE